MLDQVSREFERPGIEVCRAGTGVELLDRRLANEGPFALIITDISMPGMSGLQVANSARSAGLDTPILVISALSDPTLERQIEALGGNAMLLRKPFELDALGAAAGTLLPALKSSEASSH